MCARVCVCERVRESVCVCMRVRDNVVYRKTKGKINNDLYMYARVYVCLCVCIRECV